MATITEGVRSGRPPQSDDGQQFYEANEVPYTPGPASTNASESGEPADRILTGASAMTGAGDAARANRGLSRFRTGGSSMRRNERRAPDEYDSDVIDLLDLVGMYSAVAMIHTLTDSLQIPKSEP